jgi:hypothetical protein
LTYKNFKPYNLIVAGLVGSGPAARGQVYPLRIDIARGTKFLLAMLTSYAKDSNQSKGNFMNLAMLKMLGVSDADIEGMKNTAAQLGQRVVESEARLKSIELDVAIMRDEIAQVLTLLTEIVNNDNRNKRSPDILGSGNDGNGNDGTPAGN